MPGDRPVVRPRRARVRGAVPCPAQSLATTSPVPFFEGHHTGRGVSRRHRTRGARAAVAALALATGCGFGGGGPDEGMERFASGDGVVTVVAADRRPAAPPITGTTLDDKPLDLATERAGGVAVVNTWGSWCAPCVAEQPALERVAAATRSRGVRFVGINHRDNKLAARRHVEEFGVTYPSLFDPSSKLLPRFREFPARTVPTTYVIDRSGRIAAYAYGAIAEADLARLVDRVLAE